MTTCPNTNHPDWKALVAKIGETNAYLEYIKNNQDIPDPNDPRFDNYEQKLSLNIDQDTLPGFVSYDQQIQAISTASDVVLAYMKTHPKTVYYQNKISKKFVDNSIFSTFDESKKSEYERKVKSTGFDKAYKNFEKELLDLIEQTGDPNLTTIQDNIKPIREEVKTKLQNLGLIQKDNVGQGVKFSDESGDDLLQSDLGFEIEGLEGVEDVFVDYWKDDWAFGYDTKTKALAQVKQFLSFIPKTTINKATGEIIIQTNYLGSPDYMSYDVVYEDLTGILSNVDNTWDTMRKVLEDKIKDKPYIATVLDQINHYDFIKYTNLETDEVIEANVYNDLPTSKQSEYYKVEGDKARLIHQFVSTMSKSYAGSVTVLTNEFGNGYNFRTIDTDQSAIQKTLQNNWIVNFEQSKLLKIENGEQVVNEGVVKQLIDFIDKQAEQPTEAGISRILKAIGVELSPNTLTILSTQGLNKLAPKALFTAKKGLFRLIKERLEGYDANGLEGYNKVNPFVNNSGISALAKLESQYTAYSYTNTYRNGKGELVYGYSLNKALTTKFRRILNDTEFREKLLNTHFNKPMEVNGEPIYKTWLWQIHNNPGLAELVDFTPRPFDTIRDADTNKDGLNLSELSDKDFEALQMSFIQNNGNKVQGNRLIKYLLTVPAKTTSYLVNGIGIDISLLFEGENYKIDGKTTNALYNIFISEYNRNLYLQNNKVDYTIGNKFYFFPAFNNDSEIGKELYNSDGSLKLITSDINGKPFQNYIKENINKIIKEDVVKKIKEWKELGIIQNEKLVITDNSYAESYLKDKEGNQKLTYAAADFVINSILSKYNLHQLVINDPALYAKKSIKETWDNIDKRLASLIAPGKDLSLVSTSEDFISVKLQDQEIAALNQAELEARLGIYGEAYKGIEATDAQEYTTLKEHLFVLYRLGEISTEQYNNLLKKLDEQGDDLILAKSDLDKILQPLKPVYSDTIIRGDGNVYEEYIKSSSIPLLPQFTKGLEIDKLRKAIEKLEKQTGKLVRVAHKSATKLGGTKFANIYNSDNTIKDDLDLSDSYTILGRQGFRLQQEIPDGTTKQHVVKSTQATKLLFDSILGLDGFSYKGAEYTAKHLLEEYNKLHKAIYEKGAKSVDEKLKDLYGNLDVKKLQKILLEEAINREYSESDIQALQLNQFGEFKIALWASPAATKLEALITSIYSNNIIKQKMHGKSYVLVSEAGIKGRSSGITYTEKYEGELKPFRMENGKVLPAQVLMPWNFKDGKTRISINKYIKDDGLLDLTKVPEEILQQFGFRIPNQGHNSMSLIEVVGFLPEAMGDIVIAPRNFVKQMGSDFDVDKLYVYDYFVKLDENKNVIKKNVDKNDILDIHKSILFNPKVFDKIVKPLDTGKLKDQEGKGIAVDLKKVYEKKYSNYLNPNYSRDKYLQSVDAKMMVGITSLTSTFSSLIQDKNLYLQRRVFDDKGKVKYIDDFIVIGDSKGNEVFLNDLSNPYTINIETTERTTRTKTEVISAKQSAAVDNEKDPIIFFINLNSITAPISSLFDHLGIEEEYSSLFISQPSIREFVQLVKNNKGIFSDDIKKNKEILNNLILSYQDNEIGLDESNLSDYPLTSDHLRQSIFKDAAKTNLSDKQIQYLTLMKFRKMLDFGDVIDRAKNTINIDAKGIGKSLLEVADRANKITGLADQYKIANLIDVIGKYTINENEEQVFIPTTFQGEAISNGLLKADRELNSEDLMPYNSSTFRQVLITYKQLTGQEIISVETQKELFNNLKSYIYSGFYSTRDRERIFFERKNNKSLAKSLLELKNNPKYKNNQFLLRLLVEPASIDLTGKTPSRIYYNSAKEQNIEEYQIRKDFNALVNNEDEYIRSIGKDLVDYFFINGGLKGSRDWSNYIDLDYLHATGFTNYVNRISFGDGSISTSSYLKQYLQHKPYLSPNLSNLKNVTINKDRTELILPEIGTENTINSLLTEDEGEPIYFPIIHIKNPRGYELYIKKPDGKTFSRIDTLGSKFYTEYDYNNRKAVSLVAKQHFQIDIPNSWAPKDFPKNEEGNIPYLLRSMEEDLGKTLESTLNKITVASEITPALDLLKSANPYIGSTKINTINNSKYQYNGRYIIKDKAIDINLYRHNSKQELGKTVVHEGLHRLYDYTISKGLTPTQKVAYDNLKNIFNTLRSEIADDLHPEWDADILIQYEDIVERLMKGEDVTPQEYKFIDQHSEYYYLSDFEEFIVGFFTVRDFQQLLNKKAPIGEKNVLRRIMDAIISILEPIFKVLNVKNESLLQESIVNALTLLNNNQEGGNIVVNNTSEVKYSLTAISNQNKLENSYSKLLNDFNFRVKSLQNSIAKEKDIKSKGQLEHNLESVLSQLDELIEKVTLDNIINIANNDLSYIQNLVDNKVFSKQQINYSKTLLATWTKITEPGYELVTEEEIGTERYNSLAKIREKANTLFEIVDNVAKQELLSAVNSTTKQTITKDNLVHHKEIGVITSNLLDLSRSGNTLFNVADKWIRDSVIKANTEANNINHDVEKLVEDLKKNALFSKSGFDLFAETTDKGELTGSIVSEFKPEYNKELNRLKNSTRTKNKIGKSNAFKSLYSWLKDNHNIFDLRELYNQVETGHLVFKNSKSYLKEAENILGRDFVDRQMKLVQQYNSDLDLHIAAFGTDADGERALQAWKLKNNPFIYLKNLIEESNTESNEGDKYIVHKPKELWKNNRYEEIQNQTELKSFYDYYTNTLNQLYNYIPESLLHTSTEHSIPNISKNLREEFKEKGFSALTSGLNDFIMDSLTITANEEGTLIDPTTGKESYRLGVRYLSELNPKDKSYDLAKVLKIFALETLTYKHKAEVEDQIRLADAVIQSSLEKSTNPDGSPKNAKFGGTTTKEGLTNLKNQWNYAISAFYGRRRNEKEWATTNSKILGKELLTSKEKEQLQKEIDNINSTNKTQKEKESLIKQLKENPKRYFSYGKALDSTLKYVQLKGMGFNIFSAGTNLLFGWLSNFTWAAGREEFTTEQMLKANRIMLGSILGDLNTPAALKIRNLMDKYDTLKDISEGAYTSTASGVGFNRFSVDPIRMAYEFQRRSEYFVQGMTMVSMMLNTKVTLTDNSETNLWEGYNNPEKLPKEWGTNFDQSEGTEFLKFKNKMDQVLKSIHGNYDPNSPVLIKKSVLGRAVLQFRSWVAEGFANRFEDEKYDELLGRVRKGRYKSLADLGFTGSLKALTRAMFSNDFKVSDLTNIEGSALDTLKANIRKNLNELYQKGSLLALALLLQGLDDDDDYDDIYLKYALNNVLRLQDDIEFFYNPNSFENISRSFVPAFTLIRDTARFYDAVGSYIVTGEDEIPTGSYAGQSRIRRAAFKIFPFTSAYSAVESKLTSAEEFRK